MKTVYFLLTVSLLVLTGCAHFPGATPKAKPEPETVLIIYHVKSGDEAALQKLLGTAWQMYRSEHLVYYQPHILVWSKEDENQSRFVEVFKWVSTNSVFQASPQIKAIWKQEHLLCEERDGQRDIEGNPAEIILPAKK